MTKWTYDEEGAIPLAAIYLAPDDEREVRTVDLLGAHVFLNTDKAGDVVSVEILGPAVLVSLRNLGEYLGEEATALEAEDIAQVLAREADEAERIAEAGE